MRAAKRETNKQTRARTAVKAGGFALFLLAGAPASGDLPQTVPALQASAQQVTARKVRGWWIFKKCRGSCPGYGECCGRSVI